MSFPLSIVIDGVLGIVFLAAVILLVITGLGWKRSGDTKKPVLTQSDKDHIEFLRLLNEREKQ
jgi:phosphatidylglycerophosphatase A